MHEDMKAGFRFGCGMLLARAVAALIFAVVMFVVLGITIVILAVAVNGKEETARFLREGPRDYPIRNFDPPRKAP